MPKDLLMITHLDLDGLGSPVVAETMKIPYDNILVQDYNFEEDAQLWDYICSFREVHICDISVSESKFLDLAKKVEKVLLFDHHESSKGLKKFEQVTHDDHTCGTKLYFDNYIVPRFGVDNIPPALYGFVKRVNIYDTWQATSPEWDEGLNMNRVWSGMTNWGSDTKGYGAYSEFVGFQGKKLQKLDKFRWTRKEEEIIARAKTREGKAYDEALENLTLRVDHKGRNFGVTAVGSKISIVSHELLSKEFDFLEYLIICNNYGGSYSGKMSARSKGFDCRQIFPFNGHVEAAGAEIKKELAKELVDDTALCLVYREDCGILTPEDDEYKESMAQDADVLKQSFDIFERAKELTD